MVRTQADAPPARCARSCVIYPSLPRAHVYVATPPLFTCAEHATRSAIDGHDEGTQREVHVHSRLQSLDFAAEAHGLQERLESDDKASEGRSAARGARAAVGNFARDIAADGHTRSKLHAPPLLAAQCDAATRGQPDRGERGGADLGAAPGGMASASAAAYGSHQPGGAEDIDGLERAYVLRWPAARGEAEGVALLHLTPPGRAPPTPLRRPTLSRVSSRPDGQRRGHPPTSSGATAHPPPSPAVWQDAAAATPPGLAPSDGWGALHQLVDAERLVLAGRWAAHGAALLLEWTAPSDGLVPSGSQGARGPLSSDLKMPSSDRAAWPPRPAAAMVATTLCRVDHLDGSHAYVALASGAAANLTLSPLLPSPAQPAQPAAASHLGFRFWVHEAPAVWWRPYLQCTPLWDVGMDSQNSAEVNGRTGERAAPPVLRLCCAPPVLRLCCAALPAAPCRPRRLCRRLSPAVRAPPHSPHTLTAAPSDTEPPRFRSLPPSPTLQRRDHLSPAKGD